MKLKEILCQVWSLYAIFLLFTLSCSKHEFLLGGKINLPSLQGFVKKITNKLCDHIWPMVGGKGTTTYAHRSILPKPIASKSNTYCLPTGRLISESSLLSPGVLPPNANVLLKTQQKTSEPRNHRITTQQKKSKPQKDQVVLISSSTEEGKNCRFKKVEIPQRSMVVLVEEEDQIVGSELTGRVTDFTFTLPLFMRVPNKTEYSGSSI